MKTKLLKSMRMLLVAAGLCVGANAWSNETASNTDGTWWSGFTSTYTLPGENGVYHFTFTATTLEDGEGNNAFWHGWFLVATDGKDSHGRGGTEYFVMRNDGHSWGQSTNNNDDPTNFVVTDTYDKNNPSGSGRENAMNNATVNMTITRSSGNVTVLAEVTPTTTGENPYTTQLEYKFANVTAENMGLFFGVQWGTITITSAYAENGTVTSTQYGCNFESNETLFDTSNWMASVTNTTDATLSSNVVALKGHGNTYNNATRYNFSKYNFSTLTSDAEIVKVSFDCFLPNGNPQYFDGFSIGDGSIRTSASDYSIAGSAFNIMEKRSSGVDYLYINNTSKGTETELADTKKCLNEWVHVEVLANLATKKINYIVESIDGTTTYFSEDNVSFLDPDIEAISQIDFSGRINYGDAKIDNLVITKFVDSSKQKYTLNAIDGNSNVLSKISSGWVPTGTNVYYNKYIEVNGKYYETSATTFNKTINSTGTYTVAYNPSLVTQYVEATSSNWGNSAYKGEVGTSSNPEYFSGGVSYRGASGNKTLLTVAEDGLYSVIFAVCNQNTNKTPVLSVYKNSASDENKLHEDYSITNSYKYVQTNGTGLKTIENLSLSAGDKIILSPGDNNTLIALDYIALAKTGEPATLGTNGYGTFASPYALDLANLPAGLTAYKAAVSGTTVTFTPVTEAVQANTGLLLKGDASETYSIPVATSGSDISGSNAFLVNEGGTTFDGDANYYYFGLKKNTLIFAQFDPTEVAIPANKAYLKVLKSSIDGLSSRALTIVFGDEATGISSVTSDGMKDNSIYNLQGQRVDAPKKGLYIVNGKKVIMK